jgi:hypothetical protein
MLSLQSSNKMPLHGLCLPIGAEPDFTTGGETHCDLLNRPHLIMELAEYMTSFIILRSRRGLRRGPGYEFSIIGLGVFADWDPQQMRLRFSSARQLICPLIWTMTADAVSAGRSALQRGLGIFRFRAENMAVRFSTVPGQVAPLPNGPPGEIFRVIWNYVDGANDAIDSDSSDESSSAHSDSESTSESASSV